MAAHPVQDEDRDSDESAPAPAGRLKRLLSWATSDYLHLAIVVTTMVAILGGVGLYWKWRTQPVVEASTSELDLAFEALDQGHFAEARQMAERLRDESAPHPRRLASIAFVLGVCAVHEADRTYSSDKREYYRLAARYLEEAQERGFPEEREAEGLFFLGKSLCLSGQSLRSEPILQEALNVNPGRRTEIRGLLAHCYLNRANPEFPGALEQNQAFLADPDLEASDRTRGMIQQAEILLGMGRRAPCAALVEKIRADAENRAEILLLRGRLALEEARSLKKKGQAADAVRQAFQDAIKQLRQAQSQDASGLQATRRAMYLIGICQQEMNEPRAALAQFVRTRTMFPESAEGQAASFEEAELERKSGRDREALAAYRRALSPIRGESGYDNPWISWDQLNSRLVQACRGYLDGQQFANGLALCEMLGSVFPPTQLAESEAEFHRQWGRRLLAEADQLGLKGEPQARQGKEQMRLAGETFARLARLRTASRQYPDDLWESAVCYLEGQDYRSAARMFPEYLNAEPRRRQSQALAHLGEALLALGQSDDALSALGECIDLYPRDPIAFRARLLASDASLEKNDIEKAEGFLRENLSGDQLTPASKEWRDSLFALGRLFHLAGRYEDAAAKLEEAVNRYPDSPQATEARYLLADSQRRIGQSAREKLKTELVETVRALRFRKIRESFQAATANYQQVQEALNRRQESTDLGPLERSMLRNTYFFLGDLYFALEQYDAAIKAYTLATNRFQNSPEVLEAYLQISRAHRRLNQSQDARGVLEQAKVVFSRMKPDAPFQETTNHTHAEWAEILGL